MNKKLLKVPMERVKNIVTEKNDIWNSHNLTHSDVCELKTDKCGFLSM